MLVLEIFTEVPDFTVTTQLTLLLPDVALIVVVPTAFAVTTPLLSTVAILVFELLQVTDEAPVTVRTYLFPT